jgi:hypothetical protein
LIGRDGQYSAARVNDLVVVVPVSVDLVTRCESQGAGWSGGLVADFQH